MSARSVSASVLDARFKKLLAQLAGVAGAAELAENSFVLRPGVAPSGPNVFRDSLALQPALARTQGVKFLLVDDRFAPAHLLASTTHYACDHLVLVSQFDSPTFTLHVDEGATIDSQSLTVSQGLVISCEATATVPWNPTGGALLLIEEESTVLSTAGAVAFMHSVDIFNSIFMTNNGILGDGTHNVLTAAVGASVPVTVIALSNVLNHAFGGAGNFTLQGDSTATLSATQDAPTTVFLLSDSSKTAYTPGVLANWSGTDPKEVAAALDRIAAHVGPIP